MQFPQFDDLTDEQLRVYETPPRENLFVVGPPGSGKTTLAVHRAHMLGRLKKSTLLITRNRMLVALANQLFAQIDGNSSNAFIAANTMHTYVPTDYRARLAGDIPQFEAFHYDWLSIMEDYHMRSIVPNYEHIVVDEGQNLPKGFYPWLLKYASNAATVFADEAQTTDQDSSTIQDIRLAGMPSQVPLRENHRNTREIARLAEHFHRSHAVAPGLVRRTQSATKPKLIAFDNWDDVAQRISTRLRNRAESIGVIVKLVRDANALRDALLPLMSKQDRLDVYTNGMEKGLENSIMTSTRGITILTSKSVIGLEFDCVYLQDLPRSSRPLSDDQCRLMYMLCTRARDELVLLDGPIQMTQAELANLPSEKLLIR